MALGLVDVSLGAAVLGVVGIHPVIVLVAASVATCYLVRRSLLVSARYADDELVFRNRWLVHRLHRSDIDAVSGSRIGLGVGPTAVTLRTTRRLRGLYPLKRISIEATATFDVDEMNQLQDKVADVLGARIDS